MTVKDRSNIIVLDIEFLSEPVNVMNGVIDRNTHADGRNGDGHHVKGDVQPADILAELERRRLFGRTGGRDRREEQRDRCEQCGVGRDSFVSHHNPQNVMLCRFMW